MTAERPAGAEPSLSARYRGVVCDLDGVVYRGHEAVPYAVEALEGLRAAGRGVVYATNNASRTPHDVAGQLTSLGLTLTADDVVTSSQAGARPGWPTCWRPGPRCWPSVGQVCSRPCVRWV